MVLSLKERNDADRTVKVAFRKYKHEDLNEWYPIAFYYGGGLPLTYGKVDIVEQDGTVPGRSGEPRYIWDEADISYYNETKAMMGTDPEYAAFKQYVFDNLIKDGFNPHEVTRLNRGDIANIWHSRYNKESVKRSKKMPVNESYSDIDYDNVWDAYENAKDALGADELCEALAKAMGYDALVDHLKYIYRMYDLPFNDDEEYNEACGGNKKRTKRSKKRMRETYGDFKYTASSYYGTNFSGLEDSFDTDDFSELESWVWEKVTNGGNVEVQNSETGNRARVVYDDANDGFLIVWSDKYKSDVDDNTNSGLYDVLN